MARNIRSGQLLSPFGIGQMVNFPGDESLMICGLDAWDKILTDRRSQAGPAAVDMTKLCIKEDRLQALLNVSEFRKPYPHIGQNGTGVNANLMIPAVRFPQWHYCSKCHKMRKVPLEQHDKPECSTNDCKGSMLPVRFIAVCPEGHIQDVPFAEWTHRGPLPRDGQNHTLTYHAGSGSGDLSGIWIRCSCGATRNLAGIMGERALARLNARDDQDDTDQDSASNFYTCHGYRPWLGRNGIEHPQQCGNNLRVLIRGGSNIHYPIIQSALYLPRFDEQINPISGIIIERLGRNKLETLRNQDAQGTILKIVLGLEDEVSSGQVGLDALLKDVNAYLDEDNQPRQGGDEETLRSEEYNYILAGRETENADFKALVKEFPDYTDSAFLEKHFECVVLIERLRETRVFAGFTRINPEDNRDQQQTIADLSLNTVTWLPAHVVYGEGILLKFRADKIDQWLKSPSVQKHSQRIIARYHDARRKRWPEYVDRSLNPAFIMMHTFSHLLINRLCFNCGYGSSSLRERIYFSSDPNKLMNGILIYTSSGDSEGSMGGLVRQGREKNLAKLIREAVEDAQWCSSDPVCSDVGGITGQGPDRINGAACHNCAIVPETSCEEFNMLLGRALVVDTSQQGGMGYFR